MFHIVIGLIQNVQRISDKYFLQLLCHTNFSIFKILVLQRFITLDCSLLLFQAKVKK